TRSLSAGATTTMWFWANVCGSVASPASTTTCICASFADTKTPTGAPSTICDASAEDEPKFSSTETSGWASSKAAATSVNASVNEDAAETTSSPDSGSLVAVSVGLAEGDEDAVAVVVVVDVVVSASSPP